MEVKNIKKDIKTKVREIDFNSLKIGNDSSIPFMKENENKTKPLFALEIPYFTDKSYPQILKDYWGENNISFFNLFKKAQNTGCDLICIHIEVQENKIETELSQIILNLKMILKDNQKPIIIKGSDSKNTNKLLLSEIAKEIDSQLIIAYAEESNYENIIPNTIKNNHILALRSPIDINLAKELNILSSDCGLDSNRILIDPEMGALGYGLDYAYSIIEKIKQAGFDGDTMLNMPIITFVGEETFKAKEAKSSNFNENWGEYEQRAIMWEISTASAVISAGANIVVLYHPESIKTLKEILWN